ncbi:MAG: hypothetical protein GY915_01070 [bacterium]|nr:hypothetical protein [bacterium]
MKLNHLFLCTILAVSTFSSAQASLIDRASNFLEKVYNKAYRFVNPLHMTHTFQDLSDDSSDSSDHLLGNIVRNFQGYEIESTESISGEDDVSEVESPKFDFQKEAVEVPLLEIQDTTLVKYTVHRVEPKFAKIVEVPLEIQYATLVKPKRTVRRVKRGFAHFIEAPLTFDNPILFRPSIYGKNKHIAFLGNPETTEERLEIIQRILKTPSLGEDINNVNFCTFRTGSSLSIFKREDFSLLNELLGTMPYLRFITFGSYSTDESYIDNILDLIQNIRSPHEVIVRGERLFIEALNQKITHKDKGFRLNCNPQGLILKTNDGEIYPIVASTNFRSENRHFIR